MTGPEAISVVAHIVAPDCGIVRACRQNATTIRTQSCNPADAGRLQGEYFTRGKQIAQESHFTMGPFRPGQLAGVGRHMPNDAKLGLVIGVVIVLALGALYHRNEPASGVVRYRPDAPTANAGSPGGSPYGQRRLTSATSVESPDGPAMPASNGDEPKP
jgi:hypothetical protein